MKKIVLSTVICLFTVMSSFGQSGTTGSCRWSYNSGTGTLTISGTGPMSNYSSSLGAPWSSFSTSIKTVTISEGVTSIGARAFFYHPGLTSVSIPNSVKSIGNLAFSACSGLTSVTIPNSVTTIGDGAFYSCSGLTSVTIPNSVTSIGEKAFYSCSGLTSVTIPNSVTGFASAFSGCSGLTSVTIPNSVTTIGDEAFSDCSGLTSVTIPNSVTYIGVKAFSGCRGFTSFTIPRSVTNIREKAFSGCSGLTSIFVHNTTPMVLNTNVFSEFYNTCTLYVPIGSSSSYKTAICWKNFTNIVEFAAPEQYIIATSAGRGISATIGAGSYNSGATATVDCTVQSGYTFDGWYEGSTKVSSSQSYSFAVTATRTLQARVLLSYTVTTSTGTGISATTGAGTYNSGATATVGCTVTSGYTFDGWYEGSTKVSSSQSYSFTVTTARTLQARAIRTYTITTSAGIGISATTGTGTYNSSTTATVGCTVTSGYTFDGWYEGSTKVSSAQSYSFTVTAARTLEARATQNPLEQYTVTFNPRGGSSVPAQNVVKGDLLTPPTPPTREGYAFAGWFYEIACQNEWFFNSDPVTGDIMLYAKWTEATAIETTEEADKLAIYPNPTKGEIFIRSELPIEKVEIFDIFGRTVETWRAASLQQGNLQTINVSHLPNGIYFVKISGNGKIIGTTKLIKN